MEKEEFRAVIKDFLIRDCGWDTELPLHTRDETTVEAVGSAW